MAVPNVLSTGLADGHISRSKEPGWLPLKGVSLSRDLFPPEFYASPAAAAVFNRWIRGIRRRIALFAFIKGISKAQAEAKIETDAQFTEILLGAARASSVMVDYDA